MFGMKYSIDFTNKFKKSLKKSVKRGLDPNLVLEAVSTLEETGCLPKSYKPHKLHGNYTCSKIQQIIENEIP